MKATDLLRVHHREMKLLFTRIAKSKDDVEKRDWFDSLARVLVAHDAIEREIFYPVCRKQLGDKAPVGEALVEHGVIEFSLYLADAARGAADWNAKIAVLQEMVEHHVEEEELVLFPKIVKAMTGASLDALGAKLHARFNEVREQDFRLELVASLRRALDGQHVAVPVERVKKRTLLARATSEPVDVRSAE